MTGHSSRRLNVTADDRMLFIALRKREIDLARAMVREPDDVDLWNEWHSAAVQVDAVYLSANPDEREILDDLNRMLRVVYSGAIGIEAIESIKSRLR